MKTKINLLIVTLMAVIFISCGSQSKKISIMSRNSASAMVICNCTKSVDVTSDNSDKCLKCGRHLILPVKNNKTKNMDV